MSEEISTFPILKAKNKAVLHNWKPQTDETKEKSKLLSHVNQAGSFWVHLYEKVPNTKTKQDDCLTGRTSMILPALGHLSTETERILIFLYFFSVIH